MRRFILFAVMAVTASLFVAGQGMAAEEQMGASHVGAATTTNHQNMEHVSAVVHLNREQVREMQTLLNQQGYNVGMEDGIIGQQTREALRSFQKSEGLATTGQPNRATLRALAPSAKQQEFFGLGPAYGGKQQQMEHRNMEQKQMEHQQMEQHQMRQQKQMTPKGSGY